MSRNPNANVAVAEPQNVATEAAPAQTAEQLANTKNVESARVLQRIVEGGRDYRSEALVGQILGRLLDDHISAQKRRPADQTPDFVKEQFEEITPEDTEKIVGMVTESIDAYHTLVGKFQAPMRGGIQPKSVALSFLTALRPTSGAAQKAQAKSTINAALPPK